jgi:hypothetical protein
MSRYGSFDMDPSFRWGDGMILSIPSFLRKQESSLSRVCGDVNPARDRRRCGSIAASTGVCSP